jgi:cell division protein FtsB
MSRNFFIKIFTSKIYLIVVFIIIIALSWAFWQERKRDLSNEIEMLEQKLEKELKEKQDLIKKREYFNTDTYLERQARGKLRQQKPGERVMMVEEVGLWPGEEEMFKELKEDKKTLSNPVKWWYYIIR